MAAATGGVVAANGAPSYISARSANSLISENRPTRIQAETLMVLNRLLDELLLLILSSARSLATDRIKTDGMLKVMHNNLLAKDAVLEAELELRSYIDGKRAEGAKVPLGLLATSRLDGTENFPVTAAYNALRIRCQYYSTLGDREDDSAGTDQNIMSSDGRPIATITPGVAIYVTALLEFVGEHILQNVARVIERDNSDEASLYDLKAALTEDEQLAGLFSRMAIKEEVQRRIELLEGKRTRRLNGSGLPDDRHKGGKGETRVVKPWQVPMEGDYDEAAGPPQFSGRRTSIQPDPLSFSRQGMMHERSSSSGHTLTHSTDPRDSIASSAYSPSVTATTLSVPGSVSQSTAMTSTTSSDGASVGMQRRQSSDRGWAGRFGNVKRRNSQRQSSDTGSGMFGKTLSPNEAVTRMEGSAVEPEDDFEALVASGQTMKVSLTPNRLRTIEVAKEDAEAKKNARRRPGTMMNLRRDDVTPNGTVRASLPSPAATIASRMSVPTPEATSADASINDNLNKLTRRPSSRSSLQAPSRNAHTDRKFTSPPPSSYRSPSPALYSASLNGHGTDYTLSMDDEIDLARANHRAVSASRKLQPRDGERGPSSQDMVDFLKSTPPSEPSAAFGSGARLPDQGGDSAKKTGVGSRVRNLFGRKSSVSGRDITTPPHRHSVSSFRNKTQNSSLDEPPSSAESNTNIFADQARSTSQDPVGGLLGRNFASKQSMRSFSQDQSGSLATDRSSSILEKPGTSPTVSASSAAATAAAGAAAAGILGGGAAAVAATRSFRSLSQTQSTPESSEVGPVRSGSAAGSGVVGLYEEPKRAKTPPSPPSRPRQEDPPSRKVPWGYNRYSSSSYHRGEGDRGSTPTSDRRRSVGYQSSSGHGGPIYRAPAGYGDSPEFSTHSQQQGDESIIIRTPTVGSQCRSSAAQDSLAASRASSSIARRRPSTSAASVLVELEKNMRACTSVEECQALVTRALDAENGQAQTNGTGNGEIADIPDEESDAHVTLQPATTTTKAATPAAVPEPVVEKEAVPTSLQQVDQNLVVAWLLGGDDTPTFHLPPSQSTATLMNKTEPVDEGDDSLDSEPAKPYGSGALQHPSASVASLVSTYRDARDSISDESP